MQASLTNHQHYKAHQLVTQYQTIMAMANSAERLQAITAWQTQMQQYGQAQNLKQVS